MLSGRLASTLYRDGRFFARYAPSNRFLPEILAEHGVRSLAWHGHMYFGRKSGFEQGFAEWRLVPGIRFDPETDNDVTSDKMTALGQELLGKKENTGGRFFAWAHYMDPHDQYVKHAEAPDFGKKARDRYDAEIWFTDFWLGKLLDWAKTQPWWNDTAIIVTADHGEAFGEHDMYKHAFELWEVLVRVPMFVRVPGGKPRTNRSAPKPRRSRAHRARAHGCRSDFGHVPGALARSRALRSGAGRPRAHLVRARPRQPQPASPSARERSLQDHRLRPRPLRALRPHERCRRNDRPREEPPEPNFRR